MVRYFRLFLFLFVPFFCSFSFNVLANTSEKGQYLSEKRLLKSAWFHYPPYQYLKTPGNKKTLSGLDIEHQKLIFKEAGYNAVIPKSTWKEMVKGIKDGTQDVLFNVYYSKEKEKIGRFTKPIREQKESSFFRQEDLAIHSYQSEDELVNLIKLKNLKVGYIPGVLHVSPILNKFISDPAHKKFLVSANSHEEKLRLLQSKKIDVFLSDTIMGATVVWMEKASSEISMIEFETKLKTYMLLSKKSTTENDLKVINKAIDKIHKDKEYANLVSWYIYPILLMHTISSQWFQWIIILGMMSFSLSGVILGYRNGSTLLGTIVLCLIPSFAGGMLRDVAFGRYPIWFMRAEIYIIQGVVIGALGFFFLKFIEWKGEKSSEKFGVHKKNKIQKFLDKILMITESIAISAFTVSGVFVCLQVKAEPLVIWGPFFAFLTSAGGGLIRDLLLKFDRANLVYGPISAENSILWGFVLSYYLSISVDSIGPKTMERAVLFVVLAGFVTRFTLNFLKIPNLYMSKSRSEEEEKKLASS